MAAPNIITERKSAYFHSLSKAITNDTQYSFESKFKSSHTIKYDEVWAESIPFCPEEQDAQNFALNNTTIVKRYELVSLKEIPGSNGQAWFIEDDFKFIRPFISPVDVVEQTTNLPSIGFEAKLYKSNGTFISPTSGVWFVDYYAGIVHFETGYTPNDLGYGIPKITVYVYVGKTVADLINEVTITLQNTQSKTQLITINKTLIYNNRIYLNKKAVGDIVHNSAFIYDSTNSEFYTEFNCSLSTDKTEVLFDINDNLNGKYAVISYLAETDSSITPPVIPEPPVEDDSVYAGSLFTWGWNGDGQLGLNNTSARSFPTNTNIYIGDWKSVSCGYNFTAALKTNGSLWAWGDNWAGQLGLGDSDYGNDRSRPVQVGSLTDWKQVSSGGLYLAAIKTDGTLWTWGYNGFGNLGTNDVTWRSSPVQVGSLTNWKQVSCNDTHAVALKTDGSLWGWGDNYYGQLGTNDVISRSSPVQIGTLTDWKSVSCGIWCTYAIKTDGTLWSWGWNSSGQLGLGDDGDNKSVPTQVGSLTNWKSISSFYHTAAIKTDGTLWSWGPNWQGQLGLGDSYGSRNSPVQVGSLTNWKSVSVAGGNFTAALKTDGTIWTWGDNYNGQLGLGEAFNSKSSPVQVGSFSDWKSISANGRHCAAIKMYYPVE